MHMGTEGKLESASQLIETLGQIKKLFGVFFVIFQSYFWVILDEIPEEVFFITLKYRKVTF